MNEITPIRPGLTPSPDQLPLGLAREIECERLRLL